MRYTCEKKLAGRWQKKAKLRSRSRMTLSSWTKEADAKNAKKAAKKAKEREGEAAAGWSWPKLSELLKRPRSQEAPEAPEGEEGASRILVAVQASALVGVALLLPSE